MDPPNGAPAISVIATVLNEHGNVSDLLDSLAAQTRGPDEIVIVDGGSSDGTLQMLESRAKAGGLPLVVLSRPGANISVGRNLAIDAAKGPIIASTDAGVRLREEWLNALVEPMLGTRGARVSSGFFQADPRGAFETALGAATLPEEREIDPARFLPSSRSIAFYKDDWKRSGGYPEWLDYCEDLVFDFRLLRTAGGAAFAPAAVARFRPRPSLMAFAKQYYRYARGDGKADLWRIRHLIRYATYLGAVPGLLALALLHHAAWSLGLPVGLAMMLRRPLGRLRRQWGELDSIEKVLALGWLPIARVTGDVAKMVGYPVGVVWRLREKPPTWRSEGMAMGRWL